MLTPPQERLHWSTSRNARGDLGWGAVVIANHWKGPGGLVDMDGLELRKIRSEWHRQTIAFAGTLARQAGRSITAEDLRKGCYWLALGEPKSHKQFDNDDLDRVLNVFRLLVDPEDLAALLVWNDYQQGGKPGERKRHIWFVKEGCRAPLAYVNAILDDQVEFYKDRDFERFDLARLRALTRTLKNRHAKFHRPTARPQYAEGPF
jgi:hypothetical protein